MGKRHGSRTRSLNQAALRGLSLGLLGFIAGVSDGFAAVKISAPQFKSSGDGGVVTLKGDADFTAVKDEQAKDNQVVYEITGAKLEPGADLEIPTSSFAGSKLKLLKAYSVQDKPDTVRLVLQLAEAVPVEMKQEGKTLTLQVGNPSGSNASAASAGEAKAPAAADSAAVTPPATEASGTAKAPEAPAGAAAATSASAGSAEGATSTGAAAAGSDAAGSDAAAAQSSTTAGPPDVPTTPAGKEIQAFVDARATATFTGRPISVQVRDAELGDVLSLIAEASGFNIIQSEGVKGKITLSLVDVPWDQALDVVLRTKKLTAERSHNILRVMTLDELTSEKQAELQATRASRAAAQKVYRIFRPSYVTDLDGLRTRLISIVNASTVAVGGEGGAAANGTSTSTGGTITIDSRTNSLIVYDATETLDMMTKIIKYLDRPVAQLLIESRIVEASETFSKGLAGQLGAIGAQGGISFNGDPSVATFLGSTGAGLGVSTQPPNQSIAIAAQPTISFIPGFNRLSALLALSETENQIKTVSNPKTVTLEDQSPSVTVTTPSLVKQQIQGGSTTTPFTGTTPITSTLSLGMRPKVLADGSVKLEQLQINADDPVPDVGTSSRRLTTNVIVENGSTLMVGGVYKNSESFTGSGIPLLRNIPLLGWLFGAESKNTNRSELLFFITPRVLNEKDIGLGKTTLNL